MSHEDAVEFLGAYALDAVDGEEFAELEEHLESCPRCRAELDALREVAAAMGNSVEPLPEALWSDIASRLPERQPDEEPPAMPPLVPEGRSPFRRHRRRPPASSAERCSPRSAPSPWRPPPSRSVLGISLVQADNKVSDLQASAARSASAVTTALHAPGHRVVDLDTSTHAELAQVVVVPSGQGYLVSSNLPPLGHDRTYQLWAIEAGPTDLPRPARQRAASGRVHHGGLAAALAPEHHRRADGRLRRPDNPHRRHRESLTARQLLGSHLMPEQDTPKQRRPIEIGAEAEPVKLGSMLLTLVEPHRGHEVAYNRWYERDHFYAGCMVGPVQFRRAALRRHGRSQGPARPGPLGHHGRAGSGILCRRSTGCSTATSTCGTAGRCAR